MLIALITPQYVFANCFLLNDWTGQCDVGSLCTNGYCCEKQSECSSVKPENMPAFSHDTTGTGAVNSNINKGSANTTTKTENSALCDDGISVNTALGCLAAGNPTKMVSQLLGWGAIVGAGIAFLMIVFAGIQIVLAGGDPKKIQAARELITSAITGLILIIFSVFLINLIGVDILGLSKLGFGS